MHYNWNLEACRARCSGLMSKLILYGAPISSCSFRVRIALALKGLQHEDISLTSTAARRTAEYAGLNPQQLVPLFIHGDIKISQSIAIMCAAPSVHSVAAVICRGACIW